jgi:hypothetical protein
MSNMPQPVSNTLRTCAPLSATGYERMMARADVAAKFSFAVHSHMLQHACGFKLANDGHGCIYRRCRPLGQDFNLSNVKLVGQKVCEALLK